MSAGIKANLDGSAAIQVGGTDVINLSTSGNVAVGGSSIGNRFTVQRAAGANYIGEVYLTDGTSWMIQNSRNSAGSYNPMFQVNDSCIVYSNGTQENGSFAIGQWSTSQRGIRIDGTGNFQFNSGYGSVETAYGCRAWVNFAGATGTINASGNVSSITVNGTGDYTVNFTTAMPDINYVPVATPGGVANRNTIVAADYVSARTTSAVRFSVFSQQTGANTNPGTLNVAVMR